MCFAWYRQPYVYIVTRKRFGLAKSKMQLRFILTTWNFRGVAFYDLAFIGLLNNFLLPRPT